MLGLALVLPRARISLAERNAEREFYIRLGAASLEDLLKAGGQQMDETTIQALLQVCEGDRVSDASLCRSPSVRQSTAMFAHREVQIFF